ncbi:PDDEXK-like family protein [Hellea balneolensis]|uniref:PDDEXK-like family protein n=1 Tax=Hellea balneolensis TaxID=287478 RepID=UPI0004208E2B|nr:PD-(D/E)XK nuclease family protein [Hellea balneolensis]
MTSYNLNSRNLKKIESLLSDANEIICKQIKQENETGESFNLFSILKMESREDATHSAFIAELLNPKGSHNMEAAFLEKFLDTVKYEGGLRKNAKYATVNTEEYIGPVNYSQRTGGRIDIFITDFAGNSISIENKIYAPDQKHQIERYVNYKRKQNQNSVYYLTLFGSSPSKESAGDLDERKDFKCISYAEHVIEWLVECQNIAHDSSILRESIRQYIILVKKLTHQLSDKTMNEDLLAKIKENYPTALTIANSVEAAELSAVKLMFNEIEKELSKNPTNDWEVVYDDDLSINYSGMYLCHTNLDNEFYIKIEGQPKIHRSNLIVGLVLDESEKPVIELTKLLHSKNGEEIKTFFYESNLWWPCYGPLFDFSKIDKREFLFDQEKRKHLVTEATNRILELKNFIEKNIKDIR